MGKEEIEETHIPRLQKAIEELKDPKNVFGPFNSTEDMLKSIFDEED